MKDSQEASTKSRDTGLKATVRRHPSSNPLRVARESVLLLCWSSLQRPTWFPFVLSSRWFVLIKHLARKQHYVTLAPLASRIANVIRHSMHTAKTHSRKPNGSSRACSKIKAEAGAVAIGHIAMRSRRSQLRRLKSPEQRSGSVFQEKTATVRGTETGWEQA